MTMIRCPFCDELYEQYGERHEIHRHPEPQSGIYRYAWLDSGMPYEKWIKNTRAGQDWLEYKSKHVIHPLGQKI